MIKSKIFNKRKGLFLSACLVAVVIAGGTVTSYGDEIKRAVFEIDGNKPLDNLGEIAEQPISSSKSKLKLYDDDEKVGEIMKLENLKRTDILGNTNKEFATFEDAKAWAEKKVSERKLDSFAVLPVFWSDGIAHSYTVDAEIAEGVDMNV